MSEAGVPGLTFAVADLHGRLDLLEDALAAIETYPAAMVGKTIVFLGDYIDRGPQSAQVVERLIGGPPPGWRWICLKGNHEAMMVTVMGAPGGVEGWVANGGDATIMSYEHFHELVHAHVAWMDALPLVHEDAHRIYVHAGLAAGVALEHQQEKVLLWTRYPTEAAGGFEGRHVVHGHHPYEEGPLLRAGRTDLDTLAWYTGRLVVGVFDDAKAGGPIDLVEVRRRGS